MGVYSHSQRLILAPLQRESLVLYYIKLLAVMMMNDFDLVHSA